MNFLKLLVVMFFLLIIGTYHYDIVGPKISRFANTVEQIISFACSDTDGHMSGTVIYDYNGKSRNFVPLQFETTTVKTIYDD